MLETRPPERVSWLKMAIPANSRTAMVARIGMNQTKIVESGKRVAYASITAKTAPEAPITRNSPGSPPIRLAMEVNRPEPMPATR